ncbi:MAG: hypothetical protein COU69_01920 [Candidatus Pacebacteria bacterium CG10_big_fil_rev_8_21_14_0_10_56_10]|nr:MAG: hypothetical protein COU69_01920 [Candidatus Pacebacteria bacterium CG10_big_fil_rev_8_21_14_0_10_56_10]
MGYTKSAVAGFSWQTLLKLVMAGVALVKVSILARLLTPLDFGLFSLTTIALGITEATTQTGVNLTIVQSRQSVRYFLDSAWVIAIIRGFVIGALMIVLGLGMARLFDEPDLVGLVGLASLVPVIKGFINPTIISLQKNLRFFHDSLFRASLPVAELLIVVPLALAWRSAAAMVLAMVGAAVFEVVISFLFFSDRPRFHLRRSAAATILANAKWLSLTALLHYLAENVDNFLIGRLAGTNSLGLYHNAYSLSHKANHEFAKSTVHGTFPIFSKFHTDSRRLLRGLWRSGGALLVIALVASLPLLIAPELIVTLVLGDQWLSIVPLVPWLVAAGLVHSVATLLYSAFLARQMYGTINWHLGVTVAVLVGLLIALTPRWGLAGAVAAVLLSRLAALPLVLVALRKLAKNT